MQTKEQRNPFQSWRQNGSSLRGFDNRKLKFALPDYASRNRHQADVRTSANRRVMNSCPQVVLLFRTQHVFRVNANRETLIRTTTTRNEQVQHPFATLDRNQGHVKPWIYIFLTGY